MLPVFVINLDRRPDRWAAISENLGRLGIEATRIPAVDAKRLIAQEEWERTTNNNPPAWKIDLGAVACALSHARAMTRLLDSDAPAALFLEDDVDLAADTPALLENADWWPCDARLIRLEEGGRYPQQLWPASGRTPSGREVHELARWGNCSAAYLIDREGARMALPHCLNPLLPVDHILFNLRASRFARELRPFQIVPAMANQEGTEGSDLLEWREDAELTGIPRRLSRLRRNLRVAPYSLRLRYWRMKGSVRKKRVLFQRAPASRSPRD